MAEMILLCLLCFRSLDTVAAYIHLSQGYFNFILNMFLQITFTSKNIITLFTGISNTFMFIFNVFPQITCCSGKVFTLVTGISDTFMFIFNMFPQITCCSDKVFTLVTGISDTSCLFQYVSSDYLHQ